jgi:GntR family transcriptional repressor for pyruvate dehydrogenase complex
MAMLKPISRRTLGEQVASQIMSMISTGTFNVGDKLPPEAELCRTLNVGRSTLREGLKALSFIGMVRMRPGDGTFVGGGSSEFLDRAFGHGLLRGAEDLRDLFETRLLLETRLAALCAQRATDEELKHLEGLLAEMRNAADDMQGRFSHFDLEFHLQIAAYSHNSVLAQLLRTLRDVLSEWMRKHESTPGAHADAYSHHQKIMEALQKRDARKASRAMRSHLESIPRPFKVLLRAGIDAEAIRDPETEIPA